MVFWYSIVGDVVMKHSVEFYNCVMKLIGVVSYKSESNNCLSYGPLAAFSVDLLCSVIWRSNQFIVWFI